jgi:hypothetical protein
MAAIAAAICGSGSGHAAGCMHMAYQIPRPGRVATLVVAAVVVPFIGYSVRGSMPLVHDPRGHGGHRHRGMPADVYGVSAATRSARARSSGSW